MLKWIVYAVMIMGLLAGATNFGRNIDAYSLIGVFVLVAFGCAILYHSKRHTEGY